MLEIALTSVLMTVALYFGSIMLATEATWVTLVNTELRLFKFTRKIVSPMKVAFWVGRLIVRSRK